MKWILTAVSVIASFVIIQSNVFALDIQTDELKKAKPVIFQNYTGGERTNPDLLEVDKIGRTLAAGAAKSGRGSFLDKYSVIRAHSDEVGKLSADIFSIEKDARVNNVRMIRTILSSYYRYRFNYTKKEADVLATVTTYYNAVYRGDVNYFSGIYRKVVTSKISSSNAGLSTKYFEWPGRTKMLIPLGESGNRADIFNLADDKTTTEMRKADDKNVPARKEIVKMKEDEVKKEKAENKKQADSIAVEKKTVEKKENVIEEKKKAVQEDQKKIQEEKKKAEEIKDPAKRAEAKQEVARKEQENVKQSEDVKKSEDEVKKEKEKIVEKEKAAEQKNESTQKKADVVAAEKEQIKQDTGDKTATKPEEPKKTMTQAEVEKKAAEIEKREIAVEKKAEEVTAKLDKVYKEKMYYLKVNNWYNDGVYNNEMYIINPLTRKVILKSKYTTIAGRKYDIFSKGVVIIGYQGKTGANFDHRLVILDPEKLTEIKLGNDIIFWRSFVEVRDNNIYAVLSDGGKFFLARFNDQLVIMNRSKVEVDKDSTISFYGDFIYLTSPDKNLVVLNKADLSFSGIIDPVKDIEDK
jgi:hypothetical protein